jgi:hypothetical protein
MDDAEKKLTPAGRDANSPLVSVGVLSSGGKVVHADVDLRSIALVDSTYSKWFLKVDVDGGSYFTALTNIGTGHGRIIQRFADSHIDLATYVTKGTLWTLTPASADEFLITTGPGPNNALTTDGYAITTSPNGSLWKFSATPPIPPTPPPAGRITVATYWWGFHFKIPESLMTDWTGVGVTVGEILSLVSGFTGPAAPFVELIATYIQAEFKLARQVDEGYGVYVSMSWYAPAVFVPTPVKISDP